MDLDPQLIPGFQFIDHIAVAIPPGSLDTQLALYRAMGFREVHREDVLGRDQVREVLLEIGGGPNLIQLLEPLAPESPVARQLEKNGGRATFAHVALRVGNARVAFDHLKAHSFQVIDDAPRPGSRGTTVFFVHPKTLGYLIEVVQEGSHVE